MNLFLFVLEIFLVVAGIALVPRSLNCGFVALE